MYDVSLAQVYGASKLWNDVEKRGKVLGLVGARTRLKPPYYNQMHYVSR